MTTNDIILKLTAIWQKKIKDLKLVKTGHLIKSVKFVDSASGPQMIAEDYYQYLDGKYNISSSIIKTNEFQNLMAEYYKLRLAKEIKLT